ncbi:MAG TPA: hypothetical protein VNW96_19155 [Mycobacterium sp.]|nr:hypothetical protein [Mycobacterium sp.]
MATTDRAGITRGGPRGGTEWADMGDSFTLQNHATVTATTTPNNLAAYTVTRPNAAILTAQSAGGGVLQTVVDDFLDASNVIQTLYGFQVQASSVLAPQSTLTLSLSVYRQVGTLGVTVTGGVPITSITLAVGLTQPIPSGQTLTLTNAAGNTQVVTLSAAAVFGQKVIPISSVTPANTYAIGNPAVWQVGGQAAFGWLAAGGGTPLFAAGASVLAPGLTGNTSLITTGGSAAGTVGNSALSLQAGDSVVATIVTSAGTVVVPVCNVQPLIS